MAIVVSPVSCKMCPQATAYLLESNTSSIRECVSYSSTCTRGVLCQVPLAGYLAHRRALGIHGCGIHKEALWPDVRQERHRKSEKEAAALGWGRGWELLVPYLHVNL